MHSASGSAGISVIRKAPGEMAYIWVLSAASMRHPCGTSTTRRASCCDSGAAVNICPVDCFPEYGIQSDGRIELQAADGSSVEHYGSRDVFCMVGGEVMKVRFEVTSVKAPILSLAALADAGWRLGHQGDLLVLRRGDLSLQVDRVDTVYWLFGLGGPRLWPGGDRIETPPGAEAGIVARGIPHPARRSRPSRNDERTSSHTFLPARGARPA